MKFLFKKFLKRKAQVSKGGAILDQVIAESAAPDNKCLLYKLANFKGGEEKLIKLSIKKTYEWDEQLKWVEWVNILSWRQKYKESDLYCYVILNLIIAWSIIDIPTFFVFLQRRWLDRSNANGRPNCCRELDPRPIWRIHVQRR